MIIATYTNKELGISAHVIKRGDLAIQVKLKDLDSDEYLDITRTYSPEDFNIADDYARFLAKG